MSHNSQRLRRVVAIATNQALVALNWLNGRYASTKRDTSLLDISRQVSQSGCNALQAEVQTRVLRLLSDLYHRDCGAEHRNANAALAKLLRGRSLYDVPGGTSHLAAYELSKVSLPERASNAPLLTESSCEDIRNYLVDAPEDMLVRDAVSDGVDQNDLKYTDPILKRKQTQVSRIRFSSA